MTKDAIQGVAIVLALTVFVMFLPRGSASSAEALAPKVSVPAVYAYKPDCIDRTGGEASNCLYYRQALAAEDAVTQAKEAVKWTTWATVGAWLAAIFGAISGIGSLLQARATERSIKAQRAWIVLQRCDIKITEGPTYHAVLTWKNDGETPALNIKCRTALIDVPFGSEPEIKDDVAKLWAINPAVLGAKVEMEPVAQRIGDAGTYAAIKSKKSAQFVYASVSYNDVFESKKLRFSRAYLVLFISENGDIRTADMGNVEMS